MFNRFLYNRTDSDRVGTLIASFVGALGEVALLSQRADLSTTELTGATLILTGLNYLIGKAADKALMYVTGTGVTMVAGNIDSVHLGSDGYSGRIVADDRVTDFTATYTRR